MKMTSQKRQFDVYLYLLCIKFEPKGESVFIDVWNLHKKKTIEKRCHTIPMESFQYDNFIASLLDNSAVSEIYTDLSGDKYRKFLSIS